jgi:hypothetical protein
MIKTIIIVAITQIHINPVSQHYYCHPCPHPNIFMLTLSLKFLPFAVFLNKCEEKSKDKGVMPSLRVSL